MKSTMMAVPLSTNTMFARMEPFGQSEVISRLPDKRLVRHSFTEIAARTRALAHVDHGPRSDDPRMPLEQSVVIWRRTRCGGSKRSAKPVRDMPSS